MIAGLGFDQLDRHAQTIPNGAQAAFDDVPDAELAADLADVALLAFVGKRRISRDHEETRDAREQRDDVLGHAVGEVLVVPAVRHAVERQNRDRSLVGKRHRVARLDGAGRCRAGRHRRAIRDPLPHAHRPVYVLDLSFAQVLERQVGAIAHLLVDVAGDTDAAGFCEAFEPRRDVDAVAENIVALDDNVAHVDADAELDPFILG